MSVRQRGKSWTTKVYDASMPSGQHWIGTYKSKAEAEMAERLALSIGLASRGKPSRVWSLASKGEEKCRNCGADPERLHHIVPKAHAPGRRELGDPALNGMPLCHSCHAGWHTRAVRIARDKLLPEELCFAAGIVGFDWIDAHYPGGGPVDVDRLLLDETKLLRAQVAHLRRLLGLPTDGEAA